MKLILLLSLLTSFLSASTRIKTEFKCIDNKLFIQSIVMQEYAGHNDWRPISISLTQIFSQWGSALSVTDCKTHQALLK